MEVFNGVTINHYFFNEKSLAISTFNTNFITRQLKCKFFTSHLVTHSKI